LDETLKTSVLSTVFRNSWISLLSMTKTYLPNQTTKSFLAKPAFFLNDFPLNRVSVEVIMGY